MFDAIKCVNEVVQKISPSFCLHPPLASEPLIKNKPAGAFNKGSIPSSALTTFIPDRYLPDK